MSDWEIVRHAVAVTGSVSDAQTGQALAGALVTITDAPLEFTSWLATRAKQFGARWQAMIERPDRTRTAADGHFHFLDLPNGDYTLVASLPGYGSRYGIAEEAVSVSRGTGGNIVMATAAFQLPPTTLKGTVTAAASAPVVLAEVKVRGSGETAFSDSQGRYSLTGLEKGLRTIQINAKGYQPASQVVGLVAAGVEEILDVVLTVQT